MALTEHFTTAEQVGVALWKPEESEAELVASLGKHFSLYARELKEIQSARRRIEFLTVRRMVQLFCGTDKQYGHGPNGAPQLSDNTCRISISHTESCIALAWHPSIPIGIDVERVSSRVLRVGQRFLSDNERSRICPERELRDTLLIWSAKESLFKIIGCEEVDFKQHLHIDVSTIGPAPEGKIYARQSRTTPECHYNIDYRCYPDFVLTLCTEQMSNL